MVELVVFMTGSLGIILLSRQSITRPYSHGFPRFFAFEALLGLVVLNARNWIVRPFSLTQIISWILLLIAAYLVIHAIRTFRINGAINHNIQDSSRMAWEKTTQIVTQGPYRFIRHPMYASLLCLAWGICLKQLNLMSVLLAIVVSMSLFLTAVYEERENLNLFGDEYAKYMQHTKRFIPFVF